jgi:hypothetical protein
MMLLKCRALNLRFSASVLTHANKFRVSTRPLGFYSKLQYRSSPIHFLTIPLCLTSSAPLLLHIYNVRRCYLYRGSTARHMISYPSC